MMDARVEILIDGEEPPAVFSTYKGAEKLRFDYLESFLDQAWPVVSDLEQCNTMLLERGRIDLKIDDRASLQDYPDVISMQYSNNFGSDLQFYTRYDRIIRYDSLGSEVPDSIPITITPDEFDALMTGNYYYKGTPLDMTAFRKPAFHRMATLFPDFTKRLVMTVSNPDNKMLLLLPELFVAYKIMSQLVDTSDPSVVFDINQDGNPKLDPNYLTA